MKTKEPKRIEVKLLIPYGIIFAMAVTVASFITGWHMQQAYANKVQAEASQLVDKVSKSRQ